MKIVSLLPAATEIVCALGLENELVGRSHCCDFPPPVIALPALTRARVDDSQDSARLDEDVRRVMADGQPLYVLDEERLASLGPDVVVTQEACEVCAVSYDQVIGSLQRAACPARVVSLRPSRLVHVLEDVERVAEACGVPDNGVSVRAHLERRLGDAAATLAPTPRVAVIEWLAPPMLAGHWVPDALEAAGAVPVGLEAGVPSAYVEWDAIRGLGLDAVVVAPCGFDLERTRREAAPIMATLHGVAPRVLLLDGNAYLNRPGPRLVDAVETIAAWLAGKPVSPPRGLSV